MTTLERVKTLLGFDAENTDKDGILAILIEDAEQEFKDFCNRDDVPTTAQGVIGQMVIHRYNQLGSEGIASQSYSGISQSFSSSYSESIMQQLRKFRRLKVM